MILAHAHARVSKLVTWLTALLSAVIALVPMALYGFYVHSNVTKRLDELLRVQSVTLEQDINRQPDFWEINADRIQAGFEPHALPQQFYRVTGGNGAVVFEQAPVLAWPVVYRSRPLYAFGQPVGSIAGGLSIWRETVIGMILFAASLAAAWGIWGPVRRIPLTALKAAESALAERERYQCALLDNFPFMVWLCDGEDRLLAVNAQLAGHLGFTDGEFLRGRRLQEFLPPDQATAMTECERQVLMNGAPAHLESLVSLDGQARWFEIGIAPVGQLTGEQKGMVGYARDITERKNTEAELAKYRHHLEERVRTRTEELEIARDAAEAGSRTKSEFLASMSHELRTPLNAIIGYSQLLLMDSALPQETGEQVREIERTGEHLLALVNDILDLARIESGRLEVSDEPVPLKPLLANSLALAATLADKKGIKLIDESASEGMLAVRADAVRLKKIVINLLSNAIKYNRPGGSVRLSCWQHDSKVRILVADTGNGIPLDKQARIFTAFDRLGRECLTEEGSGIGLLITRRIVEAMDGHIGFESVAGQGSTFWVEFPSRDATDHPTRTSTLVAASL